MSRRGFEVWRFYGDPAPLAPNNIIYNIIIYKLLLYTNSHLHVNSRVDLHVNSHVDLDVNSHVDLHVDLHVNSHVIPGWGDSPIIVAQPQGYETSRRRLDSHIPRPKLIVASVYWTYTASVHWIH